MKNFKLILLFSLTALMFASCEKKQDTEQIKITKIYLDETDIEIEINKTLQLYPKYTPTNLPTPQFVWENLTPTIISVENGLVKGVSIGSGKIKLSTIETETCEKLEIIINIKVIQSKDNHIDVTNITLSHEKCNILLKNIFL